MVLLWVGQVTEHQGLRSLEGLATPAWRLYLNVDDLQSKSMVAKDTALEKGRTIRVIVEGFFINYKAALAAKYRSF